MTEAEQQELGRDYPPIAENDRRSPYVVKPDHLWDSIAELARRQFTDNPAKRLLRQLKDAGILKELRPGSGRRPAILSFPELINIVEGKKVI